MFNELHFNENHQEPSSPSTPSSSLMHQNNEAGISQSLPSDCFLTAHRNDDSFSSLNPESLQLCTEGLGSESFDDVEDSKSTDWQSQDGRINTGKNEIYVNPGGEYFRRSRSTGAVFPPPISSINGQSGKPWVSFKSYRHGGRFVLEEIRVPTQEFLHASREDGRLKLQFVQSDDEYEFINGGEGEGEDDEEEKGGQENYNDGEGEEESGGEENAQLPSCGNGGHS